MPVPLFLPQNKYDRRGLLVQETLPDPDGAGSQFPLVVMYQYDNMGRLLTVDRGFERKTRFEYNNRSWTTKITQPDPDGTGSATSPITLIGYNLRGDQTSITDPMNRLTTFVYDNEQRMTLQVDPDPDGAGPLLPPTTSWNYNANDWTTAVTDVIANTSFLYQYDALGRIVGLLEPDPDGLGSLPAPLTQYVYDSKGLNSVVDALSHGTTYVRDERGRVTAMTDTALQTTNYKYDFYDNLRQTLAPDPDGAGPLGRPATDYGYDAHDRLVSILAPANDAPNLVRPQTSFQYDSASNLKQVVDSGNNVTTYTYDSLNRVTTETNALNKSRSYTYDVAGNLTRTVDRNGRVVQYAYDALDRPIQEKWQSGPLVPTATVTTVKDGGKVAEEQTVSWTVSSATTNLAGTFTLTQGSATTVPIAWNADAATIQSALAALATVGAGNVVVTVSASSTYNRAIKLVFSGGKAGQNLPQTSINTNSLVVTPSGAGTLFKSEQTSIEGALVSEQQTIQIASAGWNQAEGYWTLSYAGQVSLPLPLTASYTQVTAALNQFEAIDNVAVTGANGDYTVTFGGTQATTNMQVIGVDVANLANGPFAHKITSNYNAVGELTSVSEPSPTANVNHDITFTRDNLGRATNILTTLDAWNIPTTTLTQKFNSVGDRIELSATLGANSDFKNTYAYDKLHRLVDVVQVGQAGATWIKPKHVQQSFNSLGQRTSIERFESLTTANPVVSTMFTYDTANRLQGIAHQQAANNLNTYAYTYDPLSRLQTVVSTAEGQTEYGYYQNSELKSVDNANVPDETYAYDANGNRNTAGYATVSDNRTVSGNGWTYQYDHEGNMTSALQGQQYWTYTWDHRNRLISAQLGSTQAITYAYDAFNRLYRRSDSNFGGDTTYWVYDEGINPVVEFETTGSQRRRVYLWSDAVDDLLASEESPTYPSGGNVLWPLADHLGTIRDIADRSSAGATTVVNHRRYDAFGQRISETNAAVDIVFGYTGKFFDEATGLQNNLNRWYNPQLGKWISQDPIGFAAGDANLYRYASNEPVSNVDLYGLEDGTSARDTVRNLLGGKKSSMAANASRAGNLAASSGLYSTERHRRAFQGAQNVQDAFAENIPGVGQVYSGSKAVTGFNPITGRQLSGFEVAMAALGAFGTFGDDAARAGSSRLRRAAEDAGETASEVSTGGKAASVAPVKEADELLNRLGTSRESASRLGRKAEEAEKVIGIHGVSVSGATPTSPASQAARKKIEEQFKVHDTPTRNDPLHKTVELPKPVTQAIADLFNSIFGR